MPLSLRPDHSPFNPTHSFIHSSFPKGLPCASHRGFNSNPDTVPGLVEIKFHGGQTRRLAAITQGNRERKSTEQAPDPAGGLVMVERMISCPGKMSRR